MIVVEYWALQWYYELYFCKIGLLMNQYLIISLQLYDSLKIIVPKCQPVETTDGNIKVSSDHITWFFTLTDANGAN